MLHVRSLSRPLSAGRVGAPRGRIRRRWLRISVSAVSGTVILVVAGAAFFLLELTPASDEFPHSQGRTFTIYITTAAAWDSWSGSQHLSFPGQETGVRFTDGGLVPGEKFFDNLSVGKWPERPGGRFHEVPKLLQRVRIFIPESVSQRQDFSISSL